MRELLVAEAAVDLPLQSLNPKEEAAQAVDELLARRVVLRPQPVERPERLFDVPHLLPRMAAASSAPEAPRPMLTSRLLLAKSFHGLLTSCLLLAKLFHRLYL